MNTNTLYIVSFFVIILFIFILYRYIKISYSNYKSKKRTQKSLKRGYIKEKEAAKYLKRKGYHILQHAKNYSYTLKFDGKSKIVTVEIDYLVKKNGRTYIVEVKSGNQAPNISNSSTRRQILEYSLFIPNDGILLLDMEKEVINEVVFPVKTKTIYNYKLIAILLSIILILATIIYFKNF